MFRFILMMVLAFAGFSGMGKNDVEVQFKRWSPVPNIRERSFWDGEAKKTYAAGILAAADHSVTVKEYPPSGLYMFFYETGNRYRYENVYSDFRRTLCNTVLAACLSNGAEHIAEAKRLMRLACAMPSWILPAHDTDHLVHDGKAMRIELVSSGMGQNIALAAMLLEPELEPELKQLVKRTLEARIIGHFEDMTNGKQKKDWLESRMNWNPVCLEGVVGTLLAADMNDVRRSELLRKAVFYSRNYVKGFSGDGYCSEGMDYWSYGLGYYMRMALKFHEVGNGAIDLMKDPKFQAVARFPERLMLADDVFPAYGDSNAFARTPRARLALAAYLLGEKPVYPLPAPSEKSANLGDTLLCIMLAGKEREVASAGRKDEFLSGFPDSGVFVLRPGEKKACRLAVSFKGRHNHESHNHNDVGSYVISVDGKCPVVIDPGLPAYTRRTFSSERYSSRITNSYGHSVPRIDGRLQVAGRNTEAHLLKKEITADSVMAAFDIRNAYRNIPGIRKLNRTFRYSRSGSGCFQVMDEAEFEEPKLFETAVITFGTFRKLADDRFAVSYRGKTLKLTIHTDGVPFEVTGDSFRDDIRYDNVMVTRLAVTLKDKAKSARVMLAFEPM